MNAEGPNERAPRARQLWLSLGHRDRDPELIARMNQEFPDGTTEASALDRRTFMTIMGASAALAGLAGCRRPVEHIVPYVSKPENVVPGEILQYATSMPFGAESYTLLADSREGRPVHVSGNGRNTMSGTALNPWASASLLDLYDPDRSQQARSDGAESTIPTFVGAWIAQYAGYAKSGGAGLALLTESSVSPTVARLLGEFRRAYPKALVASWEPVDDRAAVDGHSTAFGIPCRALCDFEKARVILSLDADFAGTEWRALQSARGFAAGRRVDKPGAKMNRLYLVESTLSQTASVADHRMQVAARDVEAIAALLARELAAQGLALPRELTSAAAASAPSINAAWVRGVAKDILAHRGTSLLVAGRRQPAHVHALLAALNHALGNTGVTVVYKQPPFLTDSDADAFGVLATAMRAKLVRTLAILGGNPQYSAPADMEFSVALGNVPEVIHLSASVDETSGLAKWHIPRLHYLEAWGDTASVDGYLGVTQPLIAPLYAGMSDIEFLSLLTSGKEAKGYDLVRETWRTLVPASASETAWRRILHDGLHPFDVAALSVTPNTATIASAWKAASTRPPLSAHNLEVVYLLSPAVHDGRFSNNGWLQEFPDPVTKLTWDNAAIMSENTATALKLKNGDLVRMQLAGRDVPMPVWIMPGQADWSVAVALGYGRTQAGRVGTGTGFNAYRIRRSTAPFIDAGLTLTVPFDSYKLACVQDHHGLDGDALARRGVKERLPMLLREATAGEYQREPHIIDERVEHPPLRSLWDDHVYDTGHQWGMSIDLTSCTGCGACTIACQSENNVPIVGKKQVLNGREMHWIRIDRYFSGEAGDPDVRVQPVGCMHCEMAPCEQVCPVAATSHDEEGLNVMAYNRCIGTRYCSNNCPYKVRRFNFYNYQKDLPESQKMAMNPDVTVRFRGVMEKCTYCTQRIERARIHAKRDGRALADGDIVPACESACPTQAIVFGDINDADSRVSRRKAQERDYGLLEEINMRPRTTFLAKITNPNPDMPRGGAQS
jgi:MoCo/4Fe-4S cofactor protein with predicted Tat translocation signal